MLGSNDVGGATRDELEFGGNARKTHDRQAARSARPAPLPAEFAGGDHTNNPVAAPAATE